MSASNSKEGASGAYSCNTNKTLTGATSPNFPELPNSTAASEFYLNVCVYEPSAYPSSHLPAFSLQLVAAFFNNRKKENHVPVLIFGRRNREPAFGRRS